jgi:DNA helicase-2/ATP-dependent DNA helicase PcrA
MRLLQEYNDSYNDFSVLDNMKNIHFINRHYNKIGICNIHKIEDKNACMKKYVDSNRFMNICNILNENPIHFQSVPTEIVAAFEQYKTLLRKHRYFDFGTIQNEFLRQLRENREFRDTIKEKIKYLIVDEYQDVNYLQSEIFMELAKLGIGVMIVGDADQAIYQFRGSDYNYIMDFEKVLDNVEVIKLEDNFRSTQGIISIAEEVIGRNAVREDKHMISRVGIYEKGDIVYKEFDNIEEEYKFIANQIEKLITWGMPAHEIGVLFRKKKYMQGLINELNNRDIPVEVENVSSLIQTSEIRAAIGIFGFLKGEVTSAELLSRWRQLSGQLKEEEIIQAIENMDKYRVHKWVGEHPNSLNQEYLLQEIYHTFLGKIGIVGYQVNGNMSESILFNLGKFSQLINDFEVINFDFSPEIKLETFYAFLKYTKDEYPEGGLEDVYKKHKGVRLMTIHKSKGLQFSAVFIPNLCKNIFPTSRKGGLSEWHFLPPQVVENVDVLRANGDRLMEDERRIFYVAATRSRKFLYLTRADYGTANTRKASAFLSETRSATGYIYEYDQRLCDFSKRQEWVPFKEEESIFAVDFTNLADFFNCGLGFKLSKMYGFVNPINLRMGYGASIHNMAKSINKHILNSENHDISSIKIEKILENFYLPYVGGAEKVRQLMFEKAAKCIKKYVSENISKFPEIEFVEKYIEVPIRKDILISGRIDLIRKKDIEGKWHIVIVDYKTGDKMPSRLEQKLQLEIYAMGYKYLTGENADVMEIVDIEGNEVVSSNAVVEENLQETMLQIEKACDNILDNNFSLRPCNKNQCKNCVQNRLCNI